MDLTISNAADPLYPLSPMLLALDARSGSSSERIHCRRAAMRAVARTVFAEHGYAGVHVRDLAKRCGVSAQTLYNNLGNREEILMSAIDELLRAQLVHAGAKNPHGGCDFFFAFCDLTSRMLESDRKYVRAIIAVVTDRQYCSAPADRIDQRCIDAYRRQLQSMHLAGDLKHWVDADSLALTLHNTICSVLAIHICGNGDAQHMRDDLITTVGLLLLGVTRNGETAKVEAAVRGAQESGRANPVRSFRHAASLQI